MNHTTLTVIVFSFLVGTLVFAIWSNTRVFAQQLPSSLSSSPSAQAASYRGNNSSSSNPYPQDSKQKCVILATQVSNLLVSLFFF